MNIAPPFTCAFLALFTLTDIDASPASSAFAYQGRLADGANAANGSYDLQFTLYDAASGGSPIAGPVTNAAVAAVGGLFTTSVDFGAGVFAGDARWLEIAVRTNGAGAFTTLSPRQELTATPYALFALSAGIAAFASTALTVQTGAVGLGGLQSNSVDSSKIVDGSIGSSKLCPTLVNGTFWRLDGNAGTTAGSSFLGTTDAEPLELKVHGQRALRLEPTADSPNLIGGSSGNWVAAGVMGGTIAGGGGSGVTNSLEGDEGYNVYGSTISGGYGNSIQYFGNAGVIGGGASNTAFYANGGTIAGGMNNFLAGEYCTIGGGNWNIQSIDMFLNSGSTISGGESNGIYGASWCIVGGGANSRIYECNNSTIGGGAGNTVGTSDYSTIAGGADNYTGYSSSVAIGGGEDNEIFSANSSTICGGTGNNIAFGGNATIAGGTGNSITGNGESSTISGGTGNAIEGGGYGSAAIGGGEGNSITSTYGTIPGGANACARSYGQMAYASGAFSAAGDAQASVYVCRGVTTNAAQTEIFPDGDSQRIIMSTNSTWCFDVLVTGRASNGNSAGYQIRGVIKNIGGTTSLVGSLTKTVLAEDVSAWDATVAADDTNDALSVRVTGAAGTNIRWVANVRTVEVTY
jgi:hypothetical protein